MKKALLLFVSLCFAFAPILAAEPQIKAFGGLSWHDGLPETVAKIQKFKPVSMKLTSNIGQARSVKLDSADGPEQIKTALKELLEESFKAMIKTRKYKAAALHKYYGINYVGHKLRKKTYLMRKYSLTADPVSIKGVPFKMTVELFPNPGHELVNPEQVFSLKILGEIYHFPMTVSSVKLLSTSPALLKNNREKQKLIVKALKVKFDGVKTNNRRWYFKKDGYLDAEVLKDGVSLKFVSERCGQFDSCAGGMYMSLTYTYDQADLEKLYTQHKFNSKKDKSMSKDAPDLGDGL